MTATHVRHSPYDRSSLHRAPSDRPCAWCGGPYADTRAAYHPTTRAYRRTYTYSPESDAGPCRPWRADRSFCNLDCWSAYYDVPPAR